MNILDLCGGENPDDRATIVLDKNIPKNHPKNIMYLQQDLNTTQTLPFTNYSIQHVISHSGYEHLTGCHQCITNEAYRILNYHGTYELTVPNGHFILHKLRWMLGIYHDINLVHHQHFHKQEIIGLFARAGFKIEFKKNWRLYLIPNLLLPTIKIIGKKIE